MKLFIHAHEIFFLRHETGLFMRMKYFFLSMKNISLLVTLHPGDPLPPFPLLPRVFLNYRVKNTGTSTPAKVKEKPG